MSNGITLTSVETIVMSTQYLEDGRNLNVVNSLWHVQTWTGRLWIKGRARVLLLEGRWFYSPVLHVEVFLGKILNPRLLLMCWSAPCMTATTTSVWTYVWINLSRFGQRCLLKAVNVMWMNNSVVCRNMGWSLFVFNNDNIITVIIYFRSKAIHYIPGHVTSCLPLHTLICPYISSFIKGVHKHDLSSMFF